MRIDLKHLIKEGSPIHGYTTYEFACSGCGSNTYIYESYIGTLKKLNISEEDFFCQECGLCVTIFWPKPIEILANEYEKR